MIEGGSLMNYILCLVNHLPSVTGEKSGAWEEMQDDSVHEQKFVTVRPIP